MNARLVFLWFPFFPVTMDIKSHKCVSVRIDSVLCALLKAGTESQWRIFIGWLYRIPLYYSLYLQSIPKRVRSQAVIDIEATIASTINSPASCLQAYPTDNAIR